VLNRSSDCSSGHSTCSLDPGTELPGSEEGCGPWTPKQRDAVRRMGLQTTPLPTEMVSGRLAPEDPDSPDHDQLNDRPTHERRNGGDVEHRSRGVEVVRPEDPIKGSDERLADVQDAGHEPVGFPGVEQEQQVLGGRAANYRPPSLSRASTSATTSRRRSSWASSNDDGRKTNVSSVAAP
jgi:hypothetical protein